MGQALKFGELEDFTPDHYREFSARLDAQVEELREQIERPSFNRNHFSLGAELEVYLVDGQYRPACANEQLLKLAGEDIPCLTPEINRYNLELNLAPVEATPHGQLFSPLEREMRSLLNALQGHASGIGANVIPIGILPTLEKKHLGTEYMTDRARYHALQKGLCGPHDKHYRIDIHGKQDHLALEGEGISVEGANTSFQVHLRVPARRFNRLL